MSFTAVNIRRLRIEAKLSPDELADAAGLSSVKMIESGKATPREHNLSAIAKVLARKLRRVVTVADLMFGEPSSEALTDWRKWRDRCEAARRARKAQQRRAS